MKFALIISLVLGLALAQGGPGGQNPPPGNNGNNEPIKIPDATMEGLDESESEKRKDRDVKVMSGDQLNDLLGPDHSPDHGPQQNTVTGQSNTEGGSTGRSYPGFGGPTGGFTGTGFPYQPPSCGAMPSDNKWCYRRCEHVLWSHRGCQTKRCTFRPTTGYSTCGMQVQIYQHYRNIQAYPAAQCLHPNRPCSLQQTCSGHQCKKYAHSPIGYCPRTRCQQRYARITKQMWARPLCGGRYQKMTVTVRVPVGCTCADVPSARACSCPFTGSFTGTGGFPGGFPSGLSGLLPNGLSGLLPGGLNTPPSYGDNYYGGNTNDYYGSYGYGGGNTGGGLGGLGLC